MADKTYRILVINPGSTSTKVGVFDGETEVFTKNVAHEASKLAEFAGVSDQMPYRRDLILEALEENGVALDTIDAFVGRGGGLLSVVGGTYQVNDVLLDHAYRGANGIQHPAQLGSQLANAFAQQVGKPAFVVNPPDTDEFCDYARMTGIKGVYRNSHLHALNLKETAIRHAHGMGKRYDECNFIVCHIGGGISITAHQQGKMIDGY
ncbi:MAG: butyrate kinase, partial [Atopobiaceae bacterium]|nr:butyrate kinase [Atopobiaceae bacterium]